MKSILPVSAVTALLFGVASAYAADLSTYEPVPEAPTPAAAYDWSGPYIGVFGGLTTGDFEYDIGPVGGPAAVNIDISASGFIGGAQVGYDWQSGNWVFGAVADIAATNHSAEINISAPIVGPGVGANLESELKYLGTVRGRVGYAWDRALLYAHGGFAYGKTEQSIDVFGINVFNEEQTRTGWTAGVGFEFAVTDRLSLGTEYSYVDLGSEEVFRLGGAAAPAIVFNEDLAFHTLKAAINFRF